MKPRLYYAIFAVIGLLVLCTAAVCAVQAQADGSTVTPALTESSVPAGIHALQTAQPEGAVAAVKEKVRISSVKVYKNGKKVKAKLTGKYNDASISASVGDTIYVVMKGKYSYVKGTTGYIGIATTNPVIITWLYAPAKKTVTVTYTRTYTAAMTDTWYLFVEGPYSTSPYTEKRLHITVTSGGGSGGTGMAQLVYQKTNQQRAAYGSGAGKNPLAWDNNRAALAQANSQWMADHNTLRHDYGWQNIANGVPGTVNYECDPSGVYHSVPNTLEGIADSIMDAWMNHDTCHANGHRNNILSAGATQIGVGAAQSSSGRWWVTQNFG